jgi:BirA family biotin operon repressor/biotin-[acetyl-CoA-carboxylase] ligase
MTVSPRQLGEPRVYLERTTSTMDEVASRATDAPEGLTIIAGEQTHGRGRADRRWHAPPGSGLLFSTLLRPGCAPEVFQVFPLVAGLAVAKAIETCTGVRVQLKWPNDLLIEDRKVAGLLLTSKVANDTVEHAILGVGINLYSVPERHDRKAISLEAVADRRPDSNLLLDESLKSLSAVYRQILSGHTQPFLDGWLKRAAYLGEMVEIVEGDQTHSGRFAGISPYGALILRDQSGEMREVHTGDLVRGPLPTAARAH